MLSWSQRNSQFESAQYSVGVGAMLVQSQRNLSQSERNAQLELAQCLGGISNAQATLGIMFKSTLAHAAYERMRKSTIC